MFFISLVLIQLLIGEPAGKENIILCQKLRTSFRLPETESIILPPFREFDLSRPFLFCFSFDWKINFKRPTFCKNLSFFRLPCNLFFVNYVFPKRFSIFLSFFALRLFHPNRNFRAHVRSVHQLYRNRSLLAITEWKQKLMMHIVLSIVQRSCTIWITTILINIKIKYLLLTCR